MIYAKLKGGLGNQLFIYAQMRKLQHEYKCPAVLDISRTLGTDGDGFYGLDKFQIDFTDIRVVRDGGEFKKEMPVRARIPAGLILLFDRFGKVLSRSAQTQLEQGIQRFINFWGYYVVADGYVKQYYNSRQKRIFMDGYYQSESYFDDIKELILHELAFKEPVPAQNEALLSRIKRSNSVCVHVRRGDYANSGFKDDFLVCTMDYYTGAAERMRRELESEVEAPAFFVFSDDVEWAKENVNISGNVEYVDGNNSAHEDLRLMSLCRHHIISNSSFSWWAQYLGQNDKQVVISPNRWYNVEKPCDIFMENWIRLDV